MELKTAIEILEYHQEWRQGRREDMIHEPKKLTEALDILLAVVKKHHSVDTNEMIDHIGDGNEMVYHKCKYCGVMTTQPDEQCYKAPTINNKKLNTETK